MIQSMTAFSRMQVQKDAFHLSWEIRSVNHRYLEVSFRLPEAFRFLEVTLRNVLKGQISRGKLECQLKYQDLGASSSMNGVNSRVISDLLSLSRQLSETYQVPNDLKVSDVLVWPGVLQQTNLDVDTLGQECVATFVEAVQSLKSMRLSEGQALSVYLVERVSELQTHLAHARHLIANMQEQIKDKLLTRLHVVKMEVSEPRMEQEIALLLTRMDVSEELDRLETHLIEVKRILKNEKIAGRRLDFLMQELNREANTLSSKSDTVELTQCAVEMKVLIEQMREQIQNIE